MRQCSKLNNRKELLLSAISAALKAGEAILKVYQFDDFGIELKSDNSPLTIADKKAHECIVTELQKYEIPILSEEGVHLDYETRKLWKQCWIIDPLDGTKEFIKRNDEFTVNIALIEKNQPILGVIYIPVYKQLYFADKSLGAYRVEDIDSCDCQLDLLIENSDKLPESGTNRNLRVLASKSHMNAETQMYIDNLKVKDKKLELISKGSSLKLCMIAENKADIYPRFGPTMEWDIAAGHAIVSAAGGKVLQVNSDRELTYNKENLLNPWFICKR